MGRVDLHRNFSSLLKDAPDIHRFPAVASGWKILRLLKKFLHRSTVLDIKYNRAALFLKQMY